MGVQPEGVEGAIADFVCFHCPLVASAEAKPLRPKANSYAESTSPKAKKSPSGKQFAPDGIFHYALTFPKLSGISTTKCGWHDKSPADTRSSGSSSAFSGYRRRKSVTGAIGHDAFASVL